MQCQDAQVNQRVMTDFQEEGRVRWRVSMITDTPARFVDFMVSIEIPRAWSSARSCRSDPRR